MQDSARRSFISRLGAAVAGTAFGARTAHAQTSSTAFSAARHTTDDWMDKLPGKHRMVIDGVTPNGAGESVLFANNLYQANKGYQLGENDLAIIVVMRHFATPWAFTDVIWNKYGKAMGEMLKFNDPKTNQPPTTNVYNVATYGMALPNLGNTIDAQLKRGTHIAICDVATHFIAGQLAQATKGDADAIYKEFAANTVPNSHFVPAGVVAVNRAQERGYTLIYAG
jgi:hypothetical protein